MNILNFLFFLLSIGVMGRISLLGSGYNLYFLEIGILISFVYLFISKRKNFTIKKNNFFDYVVFFLLIIYSILIAFKNFSSLSGIIIYTFIIISMVIFENINIDLKMFENANRVLLVSIFLQLVFVIFKLGSTLGLNYYLLKSQIITLMGASNYLSMYLGFIFVYEVVAKSKNWLLYSMISLVSLFITLSRAGIIISLGIISLFFIFNMFKNSKSFITNSSIILLIFILMLYFFKNTNMGNQLVFMTKYTISQKYYSGRDVLIKESIDQILNNPFGSGLNLEISPHNLVIQSFRDLGIFMGFVYLVYFIAPLFKFRSFSKFNSKQKGIFLAYFSLILHSFLEIFFFTTPSIFYGIIIIKVFSKSFELSRASSN